MIYILFILYCCLFCWLISRISFFTNSGLSNRILITLFLVRIIALIIGSYLNLYYFPVSDSVAFHNMGIDEFNLLFQNPKEYFVNIFHTETSESYYRLLDDSNSYWNNLRTNLLAKMLSLFDLFSFKSFVINTLFFNFLVFFGVVALYKVFIKIFPGLSLQLIMCIFLLPSALFFSAMIHRDGLILLSISMVIYHLYFMMDQQYYSWKRIIIMCLFLLVIFLLRNFVFICLLPALISWIVAQKFHRKALLSFLLVYAIISILFFSSGYISPRFNLPKYVSSRQLSFIDVGKAGASTMNIDRLEPSFRSFFRNAPQAFSHSLLRPYITEIASFEYLPFAIEILAIEILFILFLLYKIKKRIVDPLIYFCIFFSLNMFLIIGYTVPIMGAIVRYRSIYLIFLILPIIGYLNWNKVKIQKFK
ncbi:MAG: hypothetical protein ABI288_09670 [Ginsengibacter sp.]